MRGVEPAEHLVFRWSPSGYALDVRSGEPPPAGSAVAEGELRYRVSRVARSPLPHDPRWCAYLLPAYDNGSEPDASGESASEPAAPATEFDEPRDELTVLLENYPGGACVVAVDAEGRRLGLTVDSLVSLSLDPPLVGFCAPSGSMLRELLPDAGGCAITVLAGGQEWLADHFAVGARPIAMWHGLAAEPGALGAPLFVGALGWLECSLLDAVDLDSQTLFVCAVRRAEPGTEAPALVRVHGTYGSV